MENQNLYIMFEVDEDKVDVTFAYILLKANELFYFNPQLDKSELYELYEDIMLEYIDMFNFHFDYDDVAGNMKRFFDSSEHLEEETKEFIDEVFYEYINESMQLQLNNQSAEVIIDNSEPGGLGLQLDGVSALDTLTDTIESNQSDGQSPKRGHKIRAEELVNIFDSLLTIEQVKYPERYRDFEIQLSGLSLEDELAVKKQLILATDVVIHSKSDNDKISWLDIHIFLYNLAGETKELLDNYLKNKMNEDYYIKNNYFSNQLEIDKLTNFIKKVIDYDTADVLPKFSLEEQWLLTYANKMKVLTIFQTEDEDS